MPHYLTCVLYSRLAADLDTIRRAEGALPEHEVGGVNSTMFYCRLRRAQELGTVRYAGLVLLNHAMFVQHLANRDSAIMDAALRVVDPLVPGVSRTLMCILMDKQRHGNAFYSTSDNLALHTLTKVLKSLGFGADPWASAMAYLDNPVDAAPAPVAKPTFVAAAPAFPYKPKTMRSY